MFKIGLDVILDGCYRCGLKRAKLLDHNDICWFLTYRHMCSAY
jgi:hypothetical protein